KDIRRIRANSLQENAFVQFPIWRISSATIRSRTPRNPTLYAVSFKKHTPYLKTLKNSRPLPDFKEYAVYTRTIFKDPPYLFDYPTRRLTMEEILAKFIDEGRSGHKEIEIFIKEFETTNELLLKTQNNLLSELKIEVNKLSKVMSNVLIPKHKQRSETEEESDV
ncbi:hypothetical protein Tco_0646803, partial [Tanacetum coccineum]